MFLYYYRWTIVYPKVRDEKYFKLEIEVSYEQSLTTFYDLDKIRNRAVVSEMTGRCGPQPRTLHFIESNVNWMINCEFERISKKSYHTTYRNQWNSFLHTVHVVLSSRAQKPCLPHQQDIIPYVVKNLSLALLKMGRSLPETCSADLGDQ
jgi:hypothetical protein